MDKPDLITITEAADILGVHRHTVRRRIADGTLTAFHLDGDRRAIYLDRTQVTQLLDPLEYGA